MLRGYGRDTAVAESVVSSPVIESDYMASSRRLVALGRGSQGAQWCDEEVTG